MLTVGLTGNVASGKSAVAEIWRRAGVPVVSADDIARDVVAPGTPGLEEVVEAFGRGILAPDGSLDRAALRRRVFQDAGARRLLESILHPRIRAQRDRWLAARRAAGARLAVAEIPLLFEVGMEHEFDRIVFVDAARAVRLDRMIRRRGLDGEEAERIMDAQMDPHRKRQKSDFVVENDGTMTELEAAALDVLARLQGGADAQLRDP